MRSQRDGWSGCRASQNGHRAFEIVGCCREPHLQGSLRYPAPAHAPKAVAPFPGPEDLFDPASNAVYAPVPRLQSSQRVVAGTPPGACLYDLRPSTARHHSGSEDLAAIRAISIDVAGIVRERLRAGPAIVDVARRHRHLLDQRGFRIGSHMRLEAEDGFSSAMLGPGGFVVLLSRRSDHRGVYKRSGLDRDRLRSELSRHRIEQSFVQTPGDQVSPKANESGSLWRRLISREAAKPPQRRAVIQGFGELDVGQVVPDRQ